MIKFKKIITYYKESIATFAFGIIHKFLWVFLFDMLIFATCVFVFSKNI